MTRTFTVSRSSLIGLRQDFSKQINSRTASPTSTLTKYGTSASLPRNNSEKTCLRQWIRQTQTTLLQSDYTMTSPESCQLKRSKRRVSSSRHSMLRAFTTAIPSSRLRSSPTWTVILQPKAIRTMRPSGSPKPLCKTLSLEHRQRFPQSLRMALEVNCTISCLIIRAALSGPSMQVRAPLSSMSTTSTWRSIHKLVSHCTQET